MSFLKPKLQELTELVETHNRFDFTRGNPRTPGDFPVTFFFYNKHLDSAVMNVTPSGEEDFKEKLKVLKKMGFKHKPGIKLEGDVVKEIDNKIGNSFALRQCKFSIKEVNDVKGRRSVINLVSQNGSTAARIDLPIAEDAEEIARKYLKSKGMKEYVAKAEANGQAKKEGERGSQYFKTLKENKGITFARVYSVGATNDYKIVFFKGEEVKPEHTIHRIKPERIQALKSEIRKGGIEVSRNDIEIRVDPKKRYDYRDMRGPNNTPRGKA